MSGVYYMSSLEPPDDADEIAVLVSSPNPERRNPHKDAERPRWHTRPRS